MSNASTEVELQEPTSEAKLRTIHWTWGELKVNNTRQLVAVAERDFGITGLDGGATDRRKEYLGQVIKKAYATGVPIAGVPEEVLITLGLKQGVAAADEVDPDLADTHEIRVRLIIHPEANQPPYITIGVNGRVIQITREEEVAIQEAYFWVLENAKTDVHQEDGTVKPVPRFNYTVLGRVTAPKGAPVPELSRSG